MSVSQVAAVAPGAAHVIDSPVPSRPPVSNSFENLLMDGIGQVDAKVTQADQLVRDFAIDDSIPVHQVTYALEQARMSVELMMQVRSRLVEAYQDIMKMQL